MSALRKGIAWVVIAILVFSSLASVFTTQFLSEGEREAETELDVPDASQELDENSEFQDLTENTEDTEPSSQSGGRMPRFPLSPLFPLIDSEDEEPPQNMTDDSQQTEPGKPAGTQVPDDDQGGTVNSIGVTVYSDITVSDRLDSIDWGSLRPGGNKTVQCYIRNTGETAEILTLQTDNWEPSAATEYITLTWDYDEQPLNVNEVIEVNLTLDVAVNIQGVSSFVFDITIVGIGIYN